MTKMGYAATATPYLSKDSNRLWKKLRRKGAGLGREYMTPGMLEALEGVNLLVVVDDSYPFPADVFRFGDRWLFEIAPIVHSFSGSPKALDDDYEYKTALVLDCQGPGDREGEEAPAVAGHLSELDGVEYELKPALDNESAAAALNNDRADVLHLATHAHPDEFFPGRGGHGITAAELAQLPGAFRTVFSTGCHTGNPVFARAVLDSDTKYFIASMYRTSGSDGARMASVFYPALFSGATPFEAFYKVKNTLADENTTMPDLLRFVFYVE